jgi:hypothetical protein
MMNPARAPASPSLQPTTKTRTYTVVVETPLLAYIF